MVTLQLVIQGAAFLVVLGASLNDIALIVVLAILFFLPALVFDALVAAIALAAGAAALNQWWERQLDALMHRTRSRPVPGSPWISTGARLDAMRSRPVLASNASDQRPNSHRVKAASGYWRQIARSSAVTVTYKPKLTTPAPSASSAAATWKKSAAWSKARGTSSAPSP